MTSNFARAYTISLRGNRIRAVTDVYLHIRLARNRYMEKHATTCRNFLLSITIQAKR